MERMPKQPPSERRVGRAPMTLEEAVRIERQAAAGALDLSSPHVAHVVHEAHRVHVRAEVWGASGEDRRRTRRTIGIGVASVLVFIGGLAVCLSFTQ
jgi:hypothetical protein